MPHDVFVSYSSKDKVTADAVCATLESKGVRCWIAPRDILPGIDWGEAIIDAINSTRVMVLVFSSHANTSQQIKREVERAVHKGLPVIPLRIEDVPMSKSLEYFISSPHWLDAMSQPVEQHLNYLAETIKMLLSRSENVPQPEYVPTPQPRYEASPQPVWNTWTPPPQPQPYPGPAPKVESKPDYSMLVIFGMVAFSILCAVLFLFSSWSEPLRNWFTRPLHSSKIEVKNFRLNVEHDQKQSGHNGMMFYISFEILNAKDHDCVAMASFTNRDGTVVAAKNKYFATTNNTLATWIRFKPGYEDAFYNGFQLFMPYDQVTTESGKHNYNFCLRLWDQQTPLTECITGAFYVTNP